MAKGANFSPDLTAVEEATEQPGLLSSSTPSKPRHATMPVQARALYRKSALYQARNLSTNICIVSAPVLFCILLLLIQTGMSKLMSGAEFQCGCQCTQCCYKGDTNNCTSMDSSSCPYTCLAYNNRNCGLQFSVGTQVAFCDIPHPSAWPAIVQTPSEGARAAMHRPTVTILYAPGHNATLADQLSAGLLPKPDVQASTLLAAQQYLTQFSEQLPNITLPGEAFALLGAKRLGSSSAMLGAAGLYLETAFAPSGKSLYMLWPDGTCSQLGLQGAVNTSILTALQAMVNASNSAPAAALLNNRISSLGSAAAGESSAASSQVAGVNINCTDVVMTKVPTTKALQRALFCGNRLAACNGRQVTNSFAGAFDWASTNSTTFEPVVYFNDTYAVPDDGADIGAKYARTPQLLNMAVNSWLKCFVGVDASAELLAVGALPKQATVYMENWTPVLCPVLAVWILQLLLPVFVGQLVYEKENRLRMMMKMHGLEDSAYWIVQYSWFLLLYVVYAAAFLVFGHITQLAFFTRNDPGIQVGLVFIWGNTMIAMAFLLSCFFTSTRTATVFCYFFVFASGLIGYLLLRVLLDLSAYIHWVEALQVIPNLALYRGLYELGSYSYLGLQRLDMGMTADSLFDSGNGMRAAWGMLVAEWALMLVLAWYLEQVYASGTGNRRHPLFFLGRLHGQPQEHQTASAAATKQLGATKDNTAADSCLPVSFPAHLRRASSGFQAVFAKSSAVRVLPIKLHVLQALGVTTTRNFPLNLAAHQGSAANKYPQIGTPTGSGGSVAAIAGEAALAGDASAVTEPPDVFEERLRTAEVDDYEEHPLVIRGLHKVYPSQDGQAAKLAVRRLDLAVSKGECFGLLGPNGAGKSTSISVLVGLQEPSKGTAIIAGHDISHGMRPIYNIMGLCPQHDLLWATLSGREHLRFYGALKGMSGAQLEAAAESCLKAVRLWSVADKPSGSYSGGMKRRLSVAISLIGDPRVVYLDEPSTGLDPASRRVLWDVIKAAKPGRSIILTTHNMEEAEFLCDRLGIFVSGRLACIGHPKDITSRFCGFLLFTVSVPAELEAEARGLVTDMAPGARLTYSVGGTLKYELPADQVSLSRVFSTMAGLKAAELGVLDWALANATMEEVFIRITQQMNIKATE